MTSGGENRSVRRVLAALARGVLGGAYAPEVPDRILTTLDESASRSVRNQLLNALKLADGRAGALLLTGRPTPVSWLPPAEAEGLLQRWQESRHGNVRQLARGIVRLSTFAAYGYEGPGWEWIGYPGPMGPPPNQPKRITPTEIDGASALSCDVVVVGSGAGGGCVAAVLAARGYDVVVLEKGGYHNESDFTHVEPDAMRSLYLYGKTLATSDLGVQVLAGSCLGGGTLVNYATSFRLPPDTLHQWGRVSGIEAFVSGELEESFDEVSERIGVNTDSSAAGRRDQILEQGLKALGWHVDNMPRAVRGCSQDEGCGYCGFGCRLGAKQSTMRVYLEDAAEDGARIIVAADARNVIVEDGRATGIDAVVRGARVRIRAKAVVAAAGAIETPALLLRSGLRGRVGRDLRLHPATAPWARFEEEVRVWEGTTQARYSTQLRHWDGGYGPILETVPVHPGEWGPAIPWVAGERHRSLMREYPRFSFCGVLPRDASSGRVRTDKTGGVRVDYVLSAGDQRRLTEGVIAGAKVLEAAGAVEIHSPHFDPVTYTPGSDGGHERWAEQVRQIGMSTRTSQFFSYHQMGSCRMGTDPSRSAIGENNETHEVKGLFVADASAFPTASGVNPMLTVYALANRAAKKLAERLA